MKFNLVFVYDMTYPCYGLKWDGEYMWFRDLKHGWRKLASW